MCFQVSFAEYVVYLRNIWRRKISVIRKARENIELSIHNDVKNTLLNFVVQ